VVILAQLRAGRCGERTACVGKVNEYLQEMISLKTLHVRLLVLSGIIHRTLTDKSSNVTVEADRQLYILSLTGGQEIFSEILTKKFEEFIAPTIQNSTKDLCRSHSNIYISNLRNGTAWAYESK
jgi:hypothetical protein